MTQLEDHVPPERRAVWKAWDKQIRTFARCFLKHANLPGDTFSLLDAGCGLGSALDEIHKAFPSAELTGLDSDDDHIVECRTRFGAFAQFRRADLSEIGGQQDIIYASNVLEHIVAWPELARHLLDHTIRLYVLVPYRETVGGVPISRNMGHEHVATFDENAFKYLAASGIVVESLIFRAPYAWGHPVRRELLLRFRSFVSGEPFDVRRQIMFAVSKMDAVRDLGWPVNGICRWPRLIQQRHSAPRR